MVTVYSKDRCVQCTATSRKLDDVGVTGVTYLDATADNATVMLKELGYTQAPVVIPSFDKIVTDPKTGERVMHWSGFRPDLLEQL